jgi:hypothetical protein
MAGRLGTSVKSLCMDVVRMEKLQHREQTSTAVLQVSRDH